MTVEELIAKLSAYPPTMRVVVEGFDCYGFNDIGVLREIPLCIDSRPPGTAVHQEPERASQADEVALYLPRDDLSPP